MSKLIKKIAITGTLFYGIRWLFKNITRIQDEIIAKLQDKINFLKAVQMPIRFRIEDNYNGKLIIGVKFYNLDGSMIAKKNFSIPGNTPSLDIIIVKVGDKHLGFPVSLFTDAIRPIDAIDLTQYYDDNNFPKIFQKTGTDSDYIKLMSELFKLIKDKNYDEVDGEIWGSMVQPAVADVQIGNIFDVLIHTKGGVEIQKET